MRCVYGNNRLESIINVSHQVNAVTAQHQLQSDLEHRYELLFRTITSLKTETDEVSHNAEEALRTYLVMITLV